MQIVMARLLVDEQEETLQFSTKVLGFEMALMQDGMPFTSLGSSFALSADPAEYQRLQEAGVRITQPPVTMGPVTTAVFYDTCGNHIQIAQKQQKH